MKQFNYQTTAFENKLYLDVNGYSAIFNCKWFIYCIKYSSYTFNTINSIIAYHTRILCFEIVKLKFNISLQYIANIKLSSSEQSWV